MKIPVVGFLLFTSIAFITSIQVADGEEAAPAEAATIQILNLCVLPSGKGILKCKNNGSKPVKAFKGKWVVFDDFNEASQSDDILFTSNTPVLGANALLGGYLIQPNSIIYLVNDGHQREAAVGRLASDAFGNLENVPPAWKRRFKAVITDVVFDAQRPKPAKPSVIPQKQEQQHAATAGSREPQQPPIPASPDSALPAPASLRLTVDEISSWNLARVRYAINEIYAHYGTEFPNRDIQTWAERQSWYHHIPERTQEVTEKYLTADDRFNIEILAARRNALKPH